MVLTAHETYHLNAILNRQIENKKNPAMMTKLAVVGIKGASKTETEYLNYLDGVKTEVNKILSSGIFPVGLEPADIHDYLENK